MEILSKFQWVFFQISQLLCLIASSYTISWLLNLKESRFKWLPLCYSLSIVGSMNVLDNVLAIPLAERLETFHVISQFAIFCGISIYLLNRILPDLIEFISGNFSKRLQKFELDFLNFFRQNHNILPRLQYKKAGLTLPTNLKSETSDTNI